MTVLSRPYVSTTLRRPRWYFWPGVTVYFAVLAVVFTYPLVTRMGSEFVGTIGDNVYFVFLLRWFRTALIDQHVNPLNMWFLNYPQGWNLAYTEITPAQLVLGLPLALAGYPTLGYNVAFLLSFVLSGLTMFIWVRHLTKSTAAALLAGTAFACLPYRSAHFLAGHLNLVGTQWFPLYFYGFFDLLSPQKRGWKSAVLAGVGLGLIALTAQYYLYMILLISAAVVFFWLLGGNFRRLLTLHFWKQAIIAGLSALPLIALAVAPFFLLSRTGGLASRGLDSIRHFSASPTDFFLPSTDHFLWGQWIGQHFNRDYWIEATLYIGLPVLLLGILAFARRKVLNEGWLLPLLLAGGLTAVLLAMGTDLHWNAAPLEITTPEFLRARVGTDTMPLYLPGYLLFKYLPYFNKLRALMRFGIFALTLGIAAAGMGCAWLLTHFRRPALRTLTAAALILLVLVDFYPGPYPTFSSIGARPVDQWLAQQPGDGAVVQFPFSMNEDQEQIYAVLEHGKPFVGGFFNAFPPEQYARLKPIMESFPDETSIAALRELGVEYILLNRPAYPAWEETRRTCEQLGLRLLTEQGDEAVFGWKEEKHQ